jgi:regulatory protein
MTENKPKYLKGKPQSRERKPPKKISADYLHNSGLYYLQRFAASSAHFRRVMMRKIDKSCVAHPDQDKEACKALLDALIVKFISSGLLDDGAYLRGSVESLRRRGLSARAIEAKLAAKGVPQVQVRQALNDRDGEDQNADMTAAIRFAQRKRLGAKGDPSKAMAAMARAGFDYETARKALDYKGDDL